MIRILETKITQNLCSVIVILFAIGCGGKSDSDDNQQNPKKTGEKDKGLVGDVLQGDINGKSWIFAFGVARQNQKSEWFMHFYDYEPPSDPCQYGARPDGEIRYADLYVPNPEVGDLKLQDQNSRNSLAFGSTTISGSNATGEARMISDALGRIESITDKEITGYLEGKDDNGSLKGNFSATKCTSYTTR